MQSLLDPDDSTMGMADDHWGRGYGSPSHFSEVKRTKRWLQQVEQFCTN